MKMKKRSGGGGANWMDTYGDMVTLLLCFFVLLYSMSTLDQQKWLQIVQSFNPDSIAERQPEQGSGGPFVDPLPGEPQPGYLTQGDVDQQIEHLAAALKAYAEQQKSQEASQNGSGTGAGAGDSISVVQGSGYVFVSFNETVFFDPDLYRLRDDGKAVLDSVAEILAQSAESIDEIRILGHTAQAQPGEPNNIIADRYLASNRATAVLIHLQEKNFIDPARLVSLGYGQNRPIADNDTPEGRAENRRVEMIVTGLQIDNELGDSVKQYYTERTEGGTLPDEPLSAQPQD